MSGENRIACFACTLERCKNEQVPAGTARAAEQSRLRPGDIIGFAQKEEVQVMV